MTSSAFVCGLILLTSSSAVPDVHRGTIRSQRHPFAPTASTLEREIDSFVQARRITDILKQVRAWKELSPPARRLLVGGLVSRLGSAREVGIDEPADLIIPSRVAKGKLILYGHGLFIDQDLFLENGRCAWAIEQLLGCRLPVFEEGLEEKVLKARVTHARAMIRVLSPR